MEDYLKVFIETIPMRITFICLKKSSNRCVILYVMDLKQYIRPGKNASDITPLLSHSTAFSETVDKLSLPFKNKKISKIVCLEARGFLLGAAVAYKLKVGV